MALVLVKMMLSRSGVTIGGLFFGFFFFPVFWWKEGRKEGRKEEIHLIKPLIRSQFMGLNAFDCLLHFAFTSAPQQYTK